MVGCVVVGEGGKGKHGEGGEIKTLLCFFCKSTMSNPLKNIIFFFLCSLEKTLNFWM
jgi:hypothetical protein